MAAKGMKYRISAKGRKVRSEHGKKVLAEWKARVPDQGKTVHGAKSMTVRKRYTDLRTTEGRALQAIMDGFTADCGGPEALDTRQQVLLGIIRTKLITILIISDYIDKQISEDKLIVGGELMSILGGPKYGLLAFGESLKKDLETLYQGNKALSPTRIPSIAEIIKKAKEAKSDDGNQNIDR